MAPQRKPRVHPLVGAFHFLIGPFLLFEAQSGSLWPEMLCYRKISYRSAAGSPQHPRPSSPRAAVWLRNAVPPRPSRGWLTRELAPGSITALGRTSPGHPLLAPCWGDGDDKPGRAVGGAAHLGTPEFSPLVAKGARPNSIYTS